MTCPVQTAYMVLVNNYAAYMSPSMIALRAFRAAVFTAVASGLGIVNVRISLSVVIRLGLVTGA